MPLSSSPMHPRLQWWNEILKYPGNDNAGDYLTRPPALFRWHPCPGSIDEAQTIMHSLRYNFYFYFTIILN